MSDQLELSLGSLERPVPQWQPCPLCRGAGNVYDPADELDEDGSPCPRCHGAGEIDVNPATCAIPF